MFNKAHGFKKPGDGAEDRIEYHKPAKGTEGRRNNPGHHYRSPDRIGESQPIVEQESQAQAQNRFEGDGNQSVNEGVSGGLMENGVTQEVDDPEDPPHGRRTGKDSLV